jgi:hypothetical protein
MVLFVGVSFEFLLFVSRGADEQSNTIKYKIRKATEALCCTEKHTIFVYECYSSSFWHSSGPHCMVLSLIYYWALWHIVGNNNIKQNYFKHWNTSSLCSKPKANTHCLTLITYCINTDIKLVHTTQHLFTVQILLISPRPINSMCYPLWIYVVYIKKKFLGTARCESSHSVIVWTVLHLNHWHKVWYT